MSPLKAAAMAPAQSKWTRAALRPFRRVLQGTSSLAGSSSQIAKTSKALQEVLVRLS
jgi:hypothetical protein